MQTQTEHHQRAVQKVQGQIWVTSEGICSSGIASAWAIKRFIDPGARIKLVPPVPYRTSPGELSFGMTGADYTGDSERCTFEVLVERFNLSGNAMGTISEAIHDMATGENRFADRDTAKIKTLLTGIILTHDRDSKRLERSFAVLDEFYNHYYLKYQ